jgi:SpoVK/Ycf46/Vps4 family AAA+-type ATPase
VPADSERERDEIRDPIGPGGESETTRLARLTRLAQLSSFELDCLLICLAPELDPRYERLYAYIQDDVTKRRPNVDLVLNLLCRSIESKIAGRQRFLPSAPLVRHRLLQVFDDPSQPHPTLLGRYLKVDERIVNFLLESDEPEARLASYLQRVEPKNGLEDLIMTGDRRKRLRLLAQRHGEAPGLVLYLQGPYGGGRQATAEALCREMNLALLVADGMRLAGSAEAEFQTLVQLLSREALLQSSAIYWADFDRLLAEDKSTLLAVLLRELDAQDRVVFLSGETAWDPKDELCNPVYLRLEFTRPPSTERMLLWSRAFDQKEQVDLEGIANKFRFTPGQIWDAVATARNLACWRDAETARVTTADLYEACRLQCNRKLSALARKIKPNYQWDDIILPTDRVQQLREICNSVKYRSVVYDQWGFDKKLSLGKGLNILFAGPPGTGKTMAAEIIAGELALDLYKIDLSSVVSKYIGETEKNLSRIFNEAESSNAILFFDEADSLFGKRSEVRDSHDRYANIEVGYLLQRMEEYEGMVILATNFRKNMDEAFVRRMHFMVDFPFPDEPDRRQIWETVWPKETPRRPDVDLEHIARRFAITGGNIRNIALGAAFLAADNGGAVNMQHILRATRREYQKMGKVVTQDEFE